MDKREEIISYGYTSKDIKFFQSTNGHALPPLPLNVIPQGISKLKQYDPIEFERIMGVHYLTHLRFNNEDDMLQTIKNCPWLLSHTSLGDVSRELGSLYRDEIMSGYLPDLTIQWIDDGIGYGVFTNEDLVAGEYIGEYTGLVRRLYRRHPDHNAYCFQYPSRFWNWNLFVIDAGSEGNILRYMNHSDSPNLLPAWALDRGLLHMVFFAKEDIPKGTELTFNYGKDYWRLRGKLKTQWHEDQESQQGSKSDK